MREHKKKLNYNDNDDCDDYVDDDNDDERQNIANDINGSR